MSPWTGRPFQFLEHDAHPAIARTVARLRASQLAIVIASGLLLLLVLLAIRRAATHDHTGPSFAGLPLDHALVALVAGFIAIGALVVIIARIPVTLAREQAIELIDANRQLAESTIETIATLNSAIEAKDPFGAGHGLRVTLICILIAQELGLEQHEIDLLRHAATFHDIGKVAIPDEMLRHAGRFDDDQFRAMQAHPVEGARICASLQALRPAAPLVRSHHERVDGTGYPDRLAGDAIPLGSRIIAVADTWDALTSDRPCRPGQEPFLALEEIRRCAGSQFDERVVAAFVDVLGKDPWMFGLTPEDIQVSTAALPAPDTAPRGAA